MQIISLITSELPLPTLVLVVFISIVGIWFHLFYSEKTVEFGPAILTTTGIFATFIGIAAGLSGFDAKHILESVPALLDGLKTAIWGSVAGVFWALTIKYRLYIFGIGSKAPEVGQGGATVDDIVKSLGGIYWALAGNEDSTLVSQLKLMRQETRDGLDALKKSQTEALQMLSKMGSAALVEALQEVIRDFNARINEQFGENFKHLNEGVAALLVWQEQHKAHVEAVSSRLDQVVENSALITENHQRIVSQATAFTATAEGLSSLLEALETQKEQILAYASSLGELLNSAQGSIPKIEERIVAISDQLGRASTQSQETLARSVEENATNIKRTLENANLTAAKAQEQHSQQISQLVTELDKRISAMIRKLDDTTTRNQEFLTRAVEESAASVKRTLEASSEASRKAVEAHAQEISQLVAKTKKQIDQLDEALGVELTKSLDAMGGQLAALSEKFVSDYGPLTEKLRKIVAIAEGV